MFFIFGYLSLFSFIHSFILSQVDEVFWSFWVYTGSLLRQNILVWARDGFNSVISFKQIVYLCRIAKHFGNLFIYFFFLSLWSLFIKIWWNSELPTTLSFFGRNILIHFSDVGLLPSVPSTGWEVKYLLLHLRHKINSFNCYFVFSSYQSVLYVCRIGNKQFLKIKCN